MKSVGLLLALKVNCCVIQTLEHTIIKHVFMHTHTLFCKEHIHCTQTMLALQPLILCYCILVSFIPQQMRKLRWP